MNIEIKETTIIDALNKKLAEIFDVTEVPVIYVDVVPQNFTRPSLAILEIELPQDDGLKSEDYEIQDKYYMYDITYFPTKPEDIYKEFRKISHKIHTELTSINLTDKYELDRFDGIESRVTENIGHSFITFFVRVAVIDTTTKSKVKDIKTKSKVEGE